MYLRTDIDETTAQISKFCFVNVKMLCNELIVKRLRENRREH